MENDIVVFGVYIIGSDWVRVVEGVIYRRFLEAGEVVYFVIVRVFLSFYFLEIWFVESKVI